MDAPSILYLPSSVAAVPCKVHPWFPTTALLLWQLLDADVSEANSSVVALKENGAGFVHLIINLAAGGLVAFHLVVDLNAVHDDGDAVANNGRLSGLPFASRFGYEFVRSLEIINGAVSRDRRLA